MSSNLFPTSPNHQVTVTTSARLHMGFFDLTGSPERRFSGLGLAIETPTTQVQIAKSKNLVFDAKSSENVNKIVENLVESFSLPTSFSVEILHAIPAHAGLGSGTQLALAIGAGLNHLFSLNLTIAQIAKAAARGKRSGIGIGAFAQGGFIVDSGKNNSDDDEVPTITARHAFPDSWRVLLVLDSAHKGVHGAAELQAFQTLTPAKSELRSVIIDHMLPALQHADLLVFGAQMQALQAYNGDYFSSIQGGRFASQDVAGVLGWLQNNSVACVGQSSWGPTGFAILENQQQADILQAQAQLAFADKPNISFKVVQGKNTGANISGLGASELRV
ncbi:MAG TPA: beta-ribofuranosylaminobenzene 5'-phosphate synthase family protein [Methylotenera sp.]|nr:beta-ribofuranosylaminobenzene 5'-phosphate synthase family protein [Methylotenera sp.]